MPNSRLIVHLVSEATGQTLESMARACIPHFPNTHIELRHWNLVRTRTQLRRVLLGVAADPGPVMSSLIEPDLQRELEVGCARIRVNRLDVMSSTLHFLEEETGEHASGRPGSQYVMDENYFRRIDAMHYVVDHDDGQEARGLENADVVLVGVSRASKTPTCFYLANRGIKAANVPLVPGTPLPPELFKIKAPVIGLTIDAEALIAIRRTRLGVMVPARSRMDATSTTPSYIDPDLVRDELLWARKLCSRNGWSVIDVTRRSIEETSAAILDIIEHPLPSGVV